MLVSILIVDYKVKLKSPRDFTLQICSSSETSRESSLLIISQLQQINQLTLCLSARIS